LEAGTEEKRMNASLGECLETLTQVSYDFRLAANQVAVAYFT